MTWENMTELSMVHPRNQEPRIIIAENFRENVDSWSLVYRDVCTGIYRHLPLSSQYLTKLIVLMFLPNVQVCCLCFLKTLKLLVFLDSVVCVFVMFLTLELFAIVFFDEMCFMFGFSHGFISFKEVQFSGKEREFHSKVHYSIN